MNLIQTVKLTRLSRPWLGLCFAAVWLSQGTGCGRNAPPEPAAKTVQNAAPKTAATSSSAEKNGKLPAVGATETVAKEEATRAATDAPPLDQGAKLYAQHCAACHGDKGDGQGLAARFLFPKPRDFRAGRFRLISTANGVPTPADIEAVLVHGMPGSAMISWAHLDERERKLLAEQVLDLRRQGARDIELAAAKEAEETLSDAEIKESVDRVTTPGEVAAVPALAAATPEAIARGKELYLTKGCLSCHGKDGKGDGQEKMVDAEGLATRPRDLTRGIYKGNADPQSVYWRLWLGMPGSPMPSSSQNMTKEQVADLVSFVLSLSDEATRTATVMRRERLIAKSVSDVPAAVDAAAWNDVPAVKVLMTPLWWRDDAEVDFQVQAVHDARSLALRITWKDPTHNDSAVRADEFEDMAAVQLFAGDAEPFLGMGAVKGTIDLWQWRAGTRNTGASDWQSDDYPFDTPVYRELAKGAKLPDFVTARVAHNPLATREHDATSLTAAGIGSVTFRPPASQVVESAAQWKDGVWTVVLRRALAVSADDGLPLVPGQRYSIAWGVWDGAAHDRAGQKLITMWNDLKLD